MRDHSRDHKGQKFDGRKPCKGARPSSRRQLRVAEIVRHSLAVPLGQTPMVLKDGQVEASITVTGVQMSPDLRHARVYVCCLKTPTLPEDWLQQLRRRRKIIRASLDLDLKFTPDLDFQEDQSFAYADRIEAIIASEH